MPMKLISNKTKIKNFFRCRFIAGLMCVFLGVSLIGASLSLAELSSKGGMTLWLSPIKIPDDSSGRGGEGEPVGEPGDDDGDDDSDDDGDGNSGGEDDDDDGDNRSNSGGAGNAGGAGNRVGTAVSTVGANDDGGGDADGGSAGVPDDSNDNTGAGGAENEFGNAGDDDDGTVFEIWSYDLVGGIDWMNEN